MKIFFVFFIFLKVVFSQEPLEAWQWGVGLSRENENIISWMGLNNKVLDDCTAVVLSSDGSIYFNGVNSYLGQIADDSDFNFSDNIDFSVIAKVKIIDGTGYIVGKKRDFNTSGYRGWCLYYSAGAQAFAVGLDDGTRHIYGSGIVSPLNIIYTVGFTANRTTDLLHIYINGDLFSIHDFSDVGNIDVGFWKFSIGDDGDRDAPLHGNIYDVIVYKNIALTADQQYEKYVALNNLEGDPWGSWVGWPE